MGTLKYLATCGLLAVAASILFGPAQAQQTGGVEDMKATQDVIQTLQEQQKELTDNEATIDAKLATIAENVRVARLYGARAK